jgi:hypothetical protein
LISLVDRARLPAGRVREVDVARRPSVFVRPLSMDEGRKIQKISRSSKDPVRLRRDRGDDVGPRPDRPRHHLAAAG